MGSYNGTAESIFNEYKGRISTIKELAIDGKVFKNEVLTGTTYADATGGLKDFCDYVTIELPTLVTLKNV